VRSLLASHHHRFDDLEPTRVLPQGNADSLDQQGSRVMRCYFMRSGHIDVKMLSGLSDEEAVVKAKLLFSKHEGPIEGFEVWDRSRVVFRHHRDLKDRAGNADDSGVYLVKFHFRALRSRGTKLDAKIAPRRNLKARPNLLGSSGSGRSCGPRRAFSARWRSGAAPTSPLQGSTSWSSFSRGLHRKLRWPPWSASEPPLHALDP
jgi:hypothetical protein